MKGKRSKTGVPAVGSHTAVTGFLALTIVFLAVITWVALVT
jgi:hypothetical protein